MAVFELFPAFLGGPGLAQPAPSGVEIGSRKFLSQTIGNSKGSEARAKVVSVRKCQGHNGRENEVTLTPEGSKVAYVLDPNWCQQES